METFLQFIANNGFAIVVASYMIVNNNKQLMANTEAIQKMSVLIETIVKDKENV